MKPAPNEGNNGLEPPALPPNEPHYCFSDLVGLLKAQTLAMSALTQGIERLAQSNEAMVDAMLAGEDGEDEGPSSPHL